MDSQERDRIIRIIAVLVQRQGGDATITESEIAQVPDAQVLINPDRSITIKVAL